MATIMDQQQEQQQQLHDIMDQGLIHLRLGQYGTALQAFQQALAMSTQETSTHVMMMEMMVDQDELDSAHQQKEKTNDLQRKEQQPQVQLEMYPLHFPSLPESNISAHSLFDLFDRVLLPSLPTTTTTTTSNNNNNNCILCSTCCIYNIALCLHLRGLANATNSSLALQRALHFYRLALQAAHAGRAELLQDQDDEASLSSTLSSVADPYLPLLLAIYNNLAYLHCHFGQGVEMHAAVTSLSELVPQLLSYCCAASSATSSSSQMMMIMDCDDFQFFYIFQCGRFAWNAAAAA